MEIVHKRNGSAYEVAWRGGCATGWGKCPNENPIAAYELDKAGNRRHGITVCIDEGEVS